MANRRKRLCILVSLAAVLAVVTASAPGFAQSQPADPEEEFLDRRNASSRRAEDMLPFLVDHPDLLRRLEERIKGQQSQMDDAANPAPAVARQRIITLSPGTPGPVNEINTQYGYPTTITFIDITGARWPLHWEVKTAVFAQPAAPATTVAPAARRDENGNKPDDTYVHQAEHIGAITIGHGFSYSVPAAGVDGNAINIITDSPNPRGGVNIMLEGAKSSIPLMLRAMGPQGGEYDAQVTIRILAKGPQAASAIAVRPNDAPETGGSELMDMLEGHAPAQAVPLDVRGLSPDRMRAWKMGGRYFIRTDVTILSPQPLEGASGANVSIYKITAAPVVLISDNGHAHAVYLEER